MKINKNKDGSYEFNENGIRKIYDLTFNRDLGYAIVTSIYMGRQHEVNQYEELGFISKAAAKKRLAEFIEEKRQYN